MTPDPTLPSPPTAQSDDDERRRDEFVSVAFDKGVLRFGSFTTKSGRQSPYFFNSGGFDTGESLDRLGQAYADALLASGVQFDMLFGPAYKGITLSAATAIGLARRGRDVPFVFNRKEAKDHGEGGLLVGAPLGGDVVIVDDVITDGAAKRESVEMIRAAGARPVAVLIALDRAERVTDDPEALSAVQAFEASVGVPVISIASVHDVLRFLDRQQSGDPAALRDYLRRYGSA